LLIIAFYLKNNTSFSFAKIDDRLNLQTHATVLYHVNKYKDFLEFDKETIEFDKNFRLRLNKFHNEEFVKSKETVGNF